jgi:uncharacterized protein YegL
MLGKPLEDTEAGLKNMISALKRDPRAIETVHLSVIAFDTRARVLIPLTEIAMVRPPSLQAHPGTALGEALNLLRVSIVKDVKKTDAVSKGDFRPLVFILTDGRPTDEWEEAAALLRNVEPRIASVYAVGCGDEADFSIMRKITPNCVHLKKLSASSIAELFVWLSASVRAGSTGAGQDFRVGLEKLPRGGTLAPAEGANLPAAASKPRLFFHVLCRERKKYYMLTYKYRPERKIYLPEEPLPLPEGFFSEGAAPEGPEADVSRMWGLPPCPFCGAAALGRCPGCGTLFCLGEEMKECACPGCGAGLSLSPGAPSSFRGSPG